MTEREQMAERLNRICRKLPEEVLDDYDSFLDYLVLITYIRRGEDWKDWIINLFEEMLKDENTHC